MDWSLTFPVIVDQDKSVPCLMCSEDRSRFLVFNMSLRKRLKARNPLVKVDVAIVADHQLMRYRSDEDFRPHNRKCLEIVRMALQTNTRHRSH